MASRIVGSYRSARARGASVPTPPRNRQGVLALFGRVCLVAAIIALLYICGLGIREAYVKVNTQRINTVQIDGMLYRVSREEIEGAFSRFVSTSMVTLDLEQLKRELESKPWVRNAEVRRQWPDKLIIRIDEEVAIARWGQGQLLNQQGQVFEPENISAQMQLPYLSGPAGSEQKVMQQYQQFNQLLYSLGVRITDLELNGRGAWTITVIGAARSATQLPVEVKVGREEVLERLRRLVTFLESEQAGSFGLLQRIDLRYANGLAVARRDPAFLPPEAGSANEEIVAR